MLLRVVCFLFVCSVVCVDWCSLFVVRCVLCVARCSMRFDCVLCVVGWCCLLSPVYRLVCLVRRCLVFAVCCVRCTLTIVGCWLLVVGCSC